MIVGARRSGLSISQTAQGSVGFTENGPKTENIAVQPINLQ